MDRSGVSGTATEADVTAVVDEYARATCDIAFQVVSRAHLMPPAGRALLALLPVRQAEAVVLLIRIVAAARDPKVKTTIWWNYVVCDKPYAGPMIAVHTLLRRKLPFSEEMLVEMLQHVLALRGGFGRALGEPTAAIVTAVERHLTGRAPSGQLKDLLVKLERELDDASIDKKPKWAIRRMLMT